MSDKKKDAQKYCIYFHVSLFKHPLQASLRFSAGIIFVPEISQLLHAVKFMSNLAFFLVFS